MSLSLNDLREFLGNLPSNVSVVLNVNIDVASDNQTGGNTPPPSSNLMLIDTGDKASHRAKTFSGPSVGSTELGFVYDGDIVEVGATRSGFTYVSANHMNHDDFAAGYVESQFLKSK
jgi:hypothetical protein